MGDSIKNDKFLEDIDFRKLFESISSIVVVLDKKGKIRMINGSGARRLGYQVEDIMKESWFEKFIQPANKKKVKKVFDKLMKGVVDNTEHYENYVLTKNNVRAYISWHNSLIKDKNKIIGTISIGEDITDQNILAQDLIQKNKELQMFNQLLVDRELKMVELKKKIKKLKQ
jgi:PAS domain S-box-containing protein